MIPKNFSDYFTYSVEYPDPIAVLMESGTLQCYISSTFLNGWINYVKPISVRLITRYSNHDGGYQGNLERARIWHEKKEFHSDLGNLRDDILILAQPKEPKSWHHEEKDRTGEYWFFWFDNDVSDCQIGRFITTDSKEKVMEMFLAYADMISEEMSFSYGASEVPVKSIEIDPKTLRGWVKF